MLEAFALAIALTPTTLARAAFCRVMAAPALHQARLFVVEAPGRKINRCSRQRPGYVLLRQSGGEPGSPPPPMDRYDHQAPRRRRAAPIRRSVTVRRSFRSWPALAVLALVLVTAGMLLFNQQHSGSSLKIRRELRKF